MLTEDRNNLFGHALKAVNAGVVLLDENQKIVFWNNWMERHSFISEEDALDKTLPEISPDLQSVRLLTAIRQALANRLPSILSQTLNKSPLPLFASQEEAGKSIRMQQAIQVLPIQTSPESHYCMIQVTDVSAAVNRESILRQQAVELRSKAHVDGLTGIANRRRFDEHGEESFRHAKRNGTTMSLILIDIDFFKLYNDTYGHQQGDYCLIEVATALSDEVRRPFDLVARYGGEEFVVVLPETDAEGAMHIACRMRAHVESLGIQHAKPNKVNTVTISLGVAMFDPSKRAISFNELINRADHALYKAKHSGRNQIVLHEESENEESSSAI